MSDYSDLLTETDPFRARVRTAASRHARAFDWFVASAAGWARAEFVRRVDADDVTPDEVDRLLVENVGRQVALLTTHLDLGATTGRRSHWTVHVGVLQAESHHEYLKLDAGAEDVVGMFDVMDVFELPEQWRVEPWPDFRPRPSIAERLAARSSEVMGKQIG